MQETVSTSQGLSQHHVLAQSGSNGVNATISSGTKITSVSRCNDLQTGSCVQQTETGDKIDPRRVLAVLQELSRTRKRTRDRDRGKRLISDCRDPGGSVTGMNINSTLLERILYKGEWGRKLD